jgi:hypothetical protein
MQLLTERPATMGVCRVATQIALLADGAHDTSRDARHSKMRGWRRTAGVIGMRYSRS